MKDISIQKIGTDEVRLIIGSPTHALKSDPTDYCAGGIVMMELDYSSPNNCSSSNATHWSYDSDRTSPHLRYTSDVISNGWNYNMCHSAFYMKLVNEEQPIILSVDELVNPKSNPVSLPVTPTSGIYTGSADAIKLNSTAPGDGSLENDLRIGSFVRVWKTTSANGYLEVAPRGLGSGESGPTAIYDAPESVDSDLLYYSSILSLPTSSIVLNSTARSQPGASSYSDNLVGPNTAHRSFTLSEHDSRFEANNDDAFISYYTQGVRVINLADATSGNLVREKAFFDFIPRLSYDSWDPYFYNLCHDNEAGYNFWNSVDPRVGNYWLGVWHSQVDFGPNRCDTTGSLSIGGSTPLALPEHEKFVYCMTFGEGEISDDVTIDNNQVVAADPSAVGEARNWTPDGGFMIFRYFDGHLGGTISGYSSSGTWSTRPYRTVNLQGEFSVDQDVTVAAGACVNLIPGHSSDPGIFLSTALSTSSNRTIYVDGILNISVPEGDAEGTTITVDVPIVVRSGGQLNVYKINSGARVIFKKPVTINSHGSWTMHPDSDVELDYEDHICNGKFKILGTSGHIARFTGRRVTPRGSNVVMQRTTTPSYPWIVLYSQTNAFEIKYGLCENVYFDMFQPQSSGTVIELQNSDFVGDVTYRKKACMVYVENQIVAPQTYPSSTSVFDIDNCTFSSPITNPSSRPYYGAWISRCAAVNVTNSTFTSFNKGVTVTGSRQARLSGNDFNLCTEGLWIISNFAAVCDNNFNDNLSSVVSSGNTVAEYRDNIFDDTENGVYSLGGGTYWFRNNDFGDYSFGILGFGNQLYLRDRLPQTIGVDIEFGRNNFNSQYDVYGYNGGTPIAVNDINLRRYSELRVDCGYNDFLEYSTYHVSSDGTSPNFDASNNRWDNGAVYVPRLQNIGYTGTPLDQQLDPNPDCDPVASFSACSHIPCIGSFVDFSQVDTVNSTLLQAIDSLRLSVELPSLSSSCRKSVMYEFLQAVVQTDSMALYDTLHSRMNSIAANMAYTPQVRSSALMVKLSAFHFTSQIDSAEITLDTLLSRYPMEADSMQANWLGMIVKAETDTNGKFDSLLIAFGDRATADLARPKGTGGFRKGSLAPARSKDVTSPEIEIVRITPNPTSGNSVLTLRSTRTSPVLITVANTLGESVFQLSGSVTTGITFLELSLHDIGAGTYMLSASAGDARSGAVQMQITR